ncbi:MAG: hypothetical protein ABF820_10330, partial [Sporolactobacillus sp.]
TPPGSIGGQSGIRGGPRLGFTPPPHKLFGTGRGSRPRPAQTMSTDLQNRYQNAQAKTQKVRPEAIVPAPQPVPQRPSRRPNRMTDRQAVRRAFLFAECIGKPRAIEPHRAFKHR